MAQDHRAPGAEVVDVAVAVRVVEISALGAFDKRRRAAHRAESPHRRVDAAGKKRSARVARPAIPSSYRFDHLLVTLRISLNYEVEYTEACTAPNRNGMFYIIRRGSELGGISSVDDRLLVVYDGECGFCNRSIRWCLRRDGKDRLRFAPSTDPDCCGLLARHGIRPSGRIQPAKRCWSSATLGAPSRSCWSAPTQFWPPADLAPAVAHVWRNASSYSAAFSRIRLPVHRPLAISHLGTPTTAVPFPHRKKAGISLTLRNEVRNRLCGELFPAAGSC